MAVNKMIGAKFGPYEITGVLGSGGMGDVFRAEHTANGLEVALKVLPREYTVTEDGKHLARFKREIEQSSKLEHRNLCKVYDWGVSNDLHYYCMEIIEGIELGDYIKDRTSINLDEVYNMIQQLCDGLVYLHDKNVIHRDLKPSNVFLKPDKTDILADFGLLKDLGEQDITGENTRLGTPTYMSPEQFQGTAIDSRTDIYQLGVVFYKLLTGQTPFDGDSFFSLGIKVMTKKIPSPCKHNPDIPAEIERIVMKTCEKKPEKRYQSARALAGDIREYFKQRDSEKVAPKAASADASPTGASSDKPLQTAEAGLAPQKPEKKKRASLTKQAELTDIDKSSPNVKTESGKMSLKGSSSNMKRSAGQKRPKTSSSAMLNPSTTRMKAVGASSKNQGFLSEVTNIISIRLVVDLAFLAGFIGIIALSLTGNGQIGLVGDFIVEDLIGVMALVTLFSAIHYVAFSPMLGDSSKTGLFFGGIYCFSWVLTWMNCGFSFRTFILNENSLVNGGLISGMLSPFNATFTVMIYVFLPVTLLALIFHVINLLRTKNETEAIPLFLKVFIIFSALFFLLHFRSTVS